MKDSATGATRLTAETPEDISLLGGKACGLIRLMRANLSVPDAWCLPTGSKPSDSQLRQLWAQIEDSGRRKATIVAVRSSATVEDLVGASAAGVYETILGVAGPDGLIRAVRSCYDAFDATHAQAYRDKRGHVDGEIALVVQRQVASDVSGVLLTSNPRRPFAPDYVVDAAYGLGEGIVSGKVDPDHLVIDAASGNVLEERIGAKATCFVLGATGGTAEEPVSPRRSSRRALSDKQVEHLISLSRTLDTEIGEAQDCEWAFERGRLFVLQVRPITGLPPRHPKEVWSRRFGDEYLSSWTSPLGHTFLTRWITEWMFQDMSRRTGRREMAKVDPLRRYHGYVYISGSYIRSMMSAMPPSSRTVGGTGEQAWFTPLWNEEIRSAKFDPVAMVRMVTLPLTDQRGPMARNVKALAAHCTSIEDRIAPKLSQDYSALSTDEWFTQIEEIDEFGAEHFRVIRWGMGQHSATLHALLQGLLRTWCGDDNGELYRDIVSGLPGMRTAEINRGIWRLGLVARSEEPLSKAIKEGGDYKTLRESFPDSELWKGIDEFLSEHGHRSASREIAQERWAERPDIVLGFVRAQLHVPETPPDPIILEEDAVERRKAAEDLALKRSSGGIGGALKKTVLRAVIERTQTFTRYREDQRYHLDFLLAHCRQLILEMGRRLSDAGVINEASEVFFLESDEFFEQARAPIPNDKLGKAVEERIEDWRVWRDRLPATYLFDDVETEGEIAEGRPAAADKTPPGAQGEFSGLGASRGKSKGPARIIRRIEELDAVEPGDILVAETIDPGWTSVFPMLGGVITETGGILSHGALLAREYGVPAVMGITGAMKALEGISEVVIDGSQGTVEIAPH